MPYKIYDAASNRLICLLSAPVSDEKRMMLLRGAGATRNAAGRATATPARAGSLQLTALAERADTGRVTIGAMLSAGLYKLRCAVGCGAAVLRFFTCEFVGYNALHCNC